jgi:purine nucleosidase
VSTATSPRKIIIDTDPGQDDAVAILAALGSPDELEVLGITTVGGNVPLELTTKNALILVELAGRVDIPVHAGHAKPQDRELVTAEMVHGKTGLDGADRPDPTVTAASGHAVDFIIEMLDRNEAVTLCPLGPLTNIADALERRPDLAANIEQIVLMGGGHFEGGNVTPAAEFNIWADPPAAATVFTSGIDLVMMPLDVTHKALTSPERIAAFADLDTTPGRATAGMLGFFERYDIGRYGSTGAPLHDPCVIAYLLDPEIFSGRRCNVEIELVSPLTMGATVVDWWGATDREPNCLVIGDLDDVRFYELLTDRIGRLA